MEGSPAWGADTLSPASPSSASLGSWSPRPPTVDTSVDALSPLYPVSPPKRAKSKRKSLTFNETVLVASLPIEEQKEAYQARRGPWSQAPQCDELWDGERRTFWERELTSEELKEVLRYRRVSKYANLVQSFNSALRINLPVPKPPAVVDDLVRRSMDLSPVHTEYHEKLKEMFGISSPPGRSPGSPDSPDSPNKRPKVDVKVSLDSPRIPATDSPRAALTKADSPSSRALLRKSSKDEDAALHGAHSHNNRHLSLSQLAAQNASKVSRSAAATAALAPTIEPSKDPLRRESLSEQDSVRKQRSNSLIRARRRRSSLLKPWFVLLYFFFPLFSLGLTHWIPWVARVVVPAYWENRAVRTALDVPSYVERLLHLSDSPMLKSTVFIGVFAVEVWSIAYLFFILLSNLMVIIVLRPVIVSLSRVDRPPTAGEPTAPPPHR